MNKEGYFSHVRHDLINLIPPNSQRILEVGCAAGETGYFIKKKLGEQVEITGIEISQEAGEKAAKRLDVVHIGNVEEITLDDKIGYFDCIVYGDVLEHLVDPWALLAKHCKYLNPQGSIIASIPNIGYVKVIDMLKRGEWKYEDAGIMDRTHLRFFTRPSIHELFQQAGLNAVVVDTIRGGMWVYKKLSRIMPAKWSDKFVQQFIILARKQ